MTTDKTDGIIIEIEVETCFACHKMPKFETWKSDQDDWRYQWNKCEHCGYRIYEEEHNMFGESYRGWNAFQEKMKRWLTKRIAQG